ncbi:MAG: hypothetical protein MUE61_15140 [Vicinamibacterales bacterium]|nr:hypothetical protein [Vicinamibacterales bacterium]
MNVRWMIPTVAVAISIATVANAQTSTAPASRTRTAAAAAPAATAQGSAGVATTVAPAAAPSDFASFDQAPPAPPSPPSPPAAATAPQAPPAPRPGTGVRSPRATTGDEPAPAEFMRRSRGQLINLRLEFTVTDQIGTAPPVKKIITMNVADGESGRIRTNAEVFRKNTAPTVVPLSVDASPEIEGTRIRLRASLEYQLLKEAPEPELPAGKTSITQSVTAILNDGVATILSQSADPLTDRKVTLEVKATIIK